MKWIKTEDKLPAYGQPVIIVIGNVVQNVTYMRDGADDCPDWFEPYFFEHDNETTCWARDVTHWMPLPELPEES